MRVIVCAGQKGGTGKTTAAISVACELSARGLRVLVVDADPQNSARTWIGVGARQGHALPTAVSMGSDMHQPGQLDALASAYDVVVIDCPSRIDDRVGAVMRSALLFAGARGGMAVLPCGPGAMDVWALGDTIEAVQAAQGLMPGLRAGILITRKTQRTVVGDQARAVLEASALPILRAELYYRMAYQEAPAAGLGTAQYRPGSQAAAEIQTLATELMEVCNGGEQASSAA